MPSEFITRGQIPEVRRRNNSLGAARARFLKASNADLEKVKLLSDIGNAAGDACRTILLQGLDIYGEYGGRKTDSLTFGRARPITTLPNMRTKRSSIKLLLGGQKSAIINKSSILKRRPHVGLANRGNQEPKPLNVVSDDPLGQGGKS